MDTPKGNISVEPGPEVAYYRAVFGKARIAAPPRTESLALTQRIAKEYRP